MRTASAAGSIGADDELLSLLDRFDGAWRGPTPPRIDEFLPPAPGGAGAGDAAIHRDRLEELIKIDLEYRWRLAPHDRAGRSAPGSAGSGPGGDPLPARPILEDYLAVYHELGPPERISPTLIGEEYRVRRRWGDRPRREEYAARFAAQGAALDSILAAVDTELATVDERATPAPVGGLSGSTWRVAPPPCGPPGASPIDPAPGALTGPACGDISTVEVPDRASRPPFEQVGRYMLGELLGMGGFGSVWRARDPELGRDVAVKLPRGGILGGRAHEERFLREARSVSRLRHRGLVAVHDAGRDHGLVYIVSELVHGRSLAQRLQQGRPGFAEAADLVAQVAEALDYIHRQGVVHRDLKPSNILLEGDRDDGEGHEPGAAPAPARPALRPRIVDFGLAKHEAGEATMTLDGQVLGTLAYMSPEQLCSPHEVDGRGDVYSLGVVLYQLLTGELPFRGATRMLQVQVLEDEPVPPRRLDDRVPRDLETIALKCLAKEPARRYATAGELADDLRRYLAGEPIRARPTGAVERLRRWCRRRPALAGLTAGLAASLLAGLAGVSWQWSRAEANLRRAEGNLVLARQLVDTMYTRVAAELDATGVLQDYQRRLLVKALEFYETYALPQSDDPQVRLEAGVLGGRVGDIQRRLGRFEEAIAADRRALELLGSLVDALPGEVPFARELIEAYGRLAFCYDSQGRADEALEVEQEAVARCKRLADEHPEVPDHRRGLANTYNNLALYEQSAGRPAQAVVDHGESIAILESLVAEYPKDPGLRFDLARGLINLAEAYRAAGRARESDEAYRRAFEHYEALTEGHNGATLAPDQLAVIHNNLAYMHAQAGRLDDAARAFRKAAEHMRAIQAGRPEDPGVRRQLSAVLYHLGTVSHLAGHRAEAEAPEQEARELQARLVAEYPMVPVYRLDLAKTDTNLGTLLGETRRVDKAEPMLAEAERLLEGLIRDHPENVEYREPLPEALAPLGRILREAGRTAEAVRAYSRARQVLEALPNLTPDAWYNLAGVRAQCAVLADDAAAARPAVGRRQAQDGAMDALRRAVAAGFRDSDRLQRDTNLDPLRSRADFRAIERGLMDAAFPVDPFAR